MQCPREESYFSSAKLSDTFQFFNMEESFDGYEVAERFDVWQKCKPQETEAALHHNKDKRIAAFEAKQKGQNDRNLMWCMVGPVFWTEKKIFVRKWKYQF